MPRLSPENLAGAAVELRPAPPKSLGPNAISYFMHNNVESEENELDCVCVMLTDLSLGGRTTVPNIDDKGNQRCNV